MIKGKEKMSTEEHSRCPRLHIVFNSKNSRKLTSTDQNFPRRKNPVFSRRRCSENSRHIHTHPARVRTFELSPAPGRGISLFSIFRARISRKGNFPPMSSHHCSKNKTRLCAEGVTGEQRTAGREHFPKSLIKADIHAQHTWCGRKCYPKGNVVLEREI